MPLNVSKKNRIPDAEVKAATGAAKAVRDNKSDIVVNTSRTQGLRANEKNSKVSRKSEIYATMDAVLVALEDDLLTNISELTPKEQLMFWKDLLEYRMPKMSRVESQVEVTKNVIRVLSDVDIPDAEVVSFGNTSDVSRASVGDNEDTEYSDSDSYTDDDAFLDSL